MSKLFLASIGILLLVILAGCTAEVPKFVDSASPVMYFQSPKCHFCIQQKPILLELADEGFRLKDMDVLANPGYWQAYNISGTPTFLADNGDRLVGLQSKDKLRDWLETHGAKIAVSGN
ncbi:MAG: thioredoxin family protein [Candidatus Diapherotrites archaeon]|nr:thioredoxin family protein [Candidatus Diapherotrites archaeon]